MTEPATTFRRMALAAAFATLAGCKPAPKPNGSDQATLDRVRTAAEQTVRAAVGRSPALPFRGEAVHAQAAPHHWAVCGQVAPFTDDPSLFVPFVSVLSTRATGDGTDLVEQHVGTSTGEANRVYLALVTYCYDHGGPTPGPVQSVPPMPPVPDTIADPAQEAAAARSAPPPLADAVGAPAPVADQVTAGGSVVMRQNANLHDGPHGAAIRVMPAGSVMRVFGAAPGGWYQVGDTAPLGWVHESMVTRRTP